MKKIAFLTPLHPQKTGIADYAEEMLPYLRALLREEFRLDLFVDDCKPNGEDVLAHHQIFQIDDYEKLRDGYDLTVYQMGNNSLHLKIYELALRFPGVVILHDFAIHHIVAMLFLDLKKNEIGYFDEVGYNHGAQVRNEAYARAANGKLGLWETNAVDYPMNRRLVETALGVVVFSQFAKDRIEAYGCPTPVHRVYLHCGGEVADCPAREQSAARQRLGLKIAADETVVGVFGFISPAKRPFQILDAVEQVMKKTGKKIRLFYVGELQPTCSELPKEIKKRGLSQQVQITGFTTSEEFLEYLDASDVCISLRCPTMGETSGVLNRALSRGKPSIVTNIGTFQELSDDTVAKIGCGDTEVAELTAALERILTNRKYRNTLSKNGLNYAEAHLKIADTAESLAEFLKSAAWAATLTKNEMYRKVRDRLLDNCRETLRTDDAILRPMARNLAESFGGDGQ